MPVGPNRNTQVQKVAIRIDEVDIARRIVHGYDKTNVLVVATFRATPAGILHVPAQNERWIASRIGMGHWHLESRLDSADQQTWAETNLGPGDIKIEAPNIYLEGTVHGIVQGSGGQGLDGLDGSTGPAGPTGPQGPDGLPGMDGLQGPQGLQGPTGTPGLDGLDGSTGPVGPQGIPGIDGVDGQRGPQGLDGLDGSTGPQGAQGPQGPAGVDGQVGMDGMPGPAGIQGLDGLDASPSLARSPLALIIALG